MKTALFRNIYKGFTNKDITLGCKVTIKDDGKVSITDKWGAYHNTREYNKMVNEVKKLIEIDGFNNPLFTDIFDTDVTINKGFDVLENIKNETKELFDKYLIDVEKHTKQKFDYLTKLTREEYFLLNGVEFNSPKVKKDKIYSNKYYKVSNNWYTLVVNVVSKGEDVYVTKAINKAKNNYENSTLRIAKKINESFADLNLLHSESNNIGFDNGLMDIVFTDGLKRVNCRSIFVMGQIQEPHFRYLVTTTKK